MKKYLVLTIGFPPEAGGLSEYIYNFTKNLEDEISVISCRLNKKKSDGAIESCYHRLDRFSVLRIPFFRYFPRVTFFLVLACAVRLWWRKKFDAVFCNHILLGPTAIILKKMFHVDYFLMVHGWDVASEGIYAGKYLDVFKHAKKIIAVSDYTKQEVLKQYPAAKDITVIHPMFSDELIRGRDLDPDFRKKLNLQGKKILLTVSRLDLTAGRKGHDLVLMSLTEVFEKHPDAVYLIVGNGDARPELELLARKLGLGGKVFFHDYDRSTIHHYYNACDLFVMPSRVIRDGGSVEGFGIVYLEAAIFGKPSVAGRSGGVADAVIHGQTGILVDPTKVGEIAGAISALLKDPEYSRRLGEAARERALSEFSSEKMRPRIQEAVEKN